MAALLMVGIDLGGVILKGNIPGATTFSETKVVAYGASASCKIEEGSSGVKVVTPSGEQTLFAGGDNSTVSVLDDFGVITYVDEDAVSYPYLLRDSDVRTYGLTEDKNLRELEIPGAGFHNSIFRGKNLGDTVTYAQGAAIKDGSFRGLFIGDYWEKLGSYVGSMNWSENVTVRWRIAGFDWFRNAGNSTYPNNLSHHVVLVPDEVLYDVAMNDSASTASGYRNSSMFNTGKSYANSTGVRHFAASNNEYCSGLLMRVDMVSTEVTDGKPSAVQQVQATLELMTEGDVFGRAVAGPVANGSDVAGFLSYDDTQLPLFRLRPDFIKIRDDYWLKDVFEDTSYCMIDADGRANKDSANQSHGVRPIICIYRE